MLDDLRKNQKSIIWMIAIIFVLGMAIMGIVDIFSPKPFVGKIYGKKVTYEEFDRLLKQSMNYHRINSPDQPITDQVLQNLNDQTWNQLVSQRVLEKQLKRYRVRVKYSDVANKFKTDPPAELKQDPTFMTNGIFDMTKYYDFIANNPQFASLLEQHIRETLPYELLEKKIKDQVKVTPDSVKADWLSKNEKASGRVVFFDWNAVHAVDIYEEEIQAFYNKNSSKYKKEANRKYRYVQLHITPSADDSLRAREDIYFVYDLVMNGGDFGELAVQYSEDPGSAQQKGSLGYFGKGRMVKAFEDVAFSMEIGDISQPFRSDFGWHFMQVTNKRTSDSGEPEVEAAHILIRVEPSEATKMNIRYEAESFFDVASKIGLEKAASDAGKTVNETNEFLADAEFIPGIGRFPHLVKEAFSNKVGYKPDPVRLGDGSYIVAELSHRQNAYIQPLEEVHEVVRREVDKDKRMTIALSDATQLFENYTDVNDLFAAIAIRGFKTSDFNDLLITRSISGIGLVKPLNKAIFETSEGQWTPLITGENGHYKAFVMQFQRPDEQSFQHNIDRYTEEYRRTKENAHYNEWQRKVMEEAKAIDMRYKYY